MKTQKIIAILCLIFALFNLSQATQVMKNYINDNWQDNRYNDHKDGTVTDISTGLMWKKCSQGQNYDSINNTCTGSVTAHNWKDALQKAQDEVFPDKSYSDWRLPNIKELASLVTLNRGNPTININIFPNTQLGPYASSSPSFEKNDSFWRISFKYGTQNLDYRSNNAYVRLVRAGQ